MFIIDQNVYDKYLCCIANKDQTIFRFYNQKYFAQHFLNIFYVSNSGFCIISKFL